MENTEKIPFYLARRESWSVFESAESLLPPIKHLKGDIWIEGWTVVRIWRILALKWLERIVEKPERDSKINWKMCCPPQVNFSDENYLKLHGRSGLKMLEREASLWAGRVRLEDLALWKRLEAVYSKVGKEVRGERQGEGCLVTAM